MNRDDRTPRAGAASHPADARDAGAAGPIARRSALAAGLGAAAALVPYRGKAASGANLPPMVPEWERHLGAPVLASPYGKPSVFEAGVVRRGRLHARVKSEFSSFSLTPLQDLAGIVTPNGLHYERHHGGVPTIDPDAYRLMVHGLVKRPLILTMDDLLRFPSVSRFHFIECSGNTQGWKSGKADSDWTAQDSHGLLSCAEWTGVPLAAILDEVGVDAKASWMLAEGSDAASMSRSVPVAKAFDDALLAYGQNGERLRPEQGYPMRLLLPGFEGNMNVKWLRRLKLGTRPFETREETSKYTELLPTGRALQFNFVMEAKSVITRPSGGDNLATHGVYPITGIAWSGRGKIKRVEVSADGGRTWRDAILQQPVMSRCLTRFNLPWHWEGAPARLQSRATDETGYVQPTHDELVSAMGVNAYYHYNGIQNWNVAPDGAVGYVLA